MNKQLNVITTLHIDGRVFKVVKMLDHYCTIETKYIGADGYLTEELNGAQTLAQSNLNDAINLRRDCCKVDKLVEEQGIDRPTAVTMVVMGCDYQKAKMFHGGRMWG